MLPYGGRASSWLFRPFCRGAVSSEAESDPSLEGWFTTFERDGGVGRRRGSRRGTLERDGVRPVGSREFGWAAPCCWALDWASLSPFLSVGLEIDAFVGPSAWRVFCVLRAF